MFKLVFLWALLGASSVPVAFGSLSDTVPKCCENYQVLDPKKQRCQLTKQNAYNFTTTREATIFQTTNSSLLQCPNGLDTFTVPSDAVASNYVTVPGSNRTLSNGELCIVNSAQNVTTLAYCKAINKCCPPGQVLHSSLRKCVPAQGAPINDRITRDDGTPLLLDHDATGPDYYLQFCLFQLRQSSDGIEFNDYNEAIISETFLNKSVNTRYFCLDSVVNQSSNNKPKMVAMVGESARKLHTKAFDLFFKIFPLFCLVSSGFLLLTSIFYLSKPKLRQNLHGSSMICFLLSMLIVQIDIGLGFSLAKRICICTFIPYHRNFFRYASSAWTTVVGYIIWSQLRSARNRSLNQQNNALRFAIYSLYAWGLPLVLVIAEVTYDHFYPLTSPCWWKTQHVTLFMDVPNITLQLLNNIFFIPSAVHVCKSLRFINESLNPKEANALKNKRRMAVIKMFAMMQSTKLAEILFSIQSLFDIKNRVYLMTSMCFYSMIGPLLFFVLVDWSEFFKTKFGMRLQNCFQSTLRYSSSVASLFKTTKRFPLNSAGGTSDGSRVQTMRYVKKQHSTASIFAQPVENSAKGVQVE